MLVLMVKLSTNSPTSVKNHSPNVEFQDMQLHQIVNIATVELTSTLGLLSTVILLHKLATHLATNVRLQPTARRLLMEHATNVNLDLL